MGRYRAIFFLWVFIVSYLSLASIEAPVSRVNVQIPGQDKAIHFVMYGIMSILGLLAFTRSKLAWIVCFVLFWGIFMEVAQNQTTSTRNFDIFDIFANIIGAIVGVIIYYKFINRFYGKS